MTAKANPKRDPRPTTMVPVTTMEELPVLSEQERTDLQASLEAAEAEIRSGQFTDYEAGAFKERLLDIYRTRKP